MFHLEDQLFCQQKDFENLFLQSKVKKAFCKILISLLL